MKSLLLTLLLLLSPSCTSLGGGGAAQSLLALESALVGQTLMECLEDSGAEPGDEALAALEELLFQVALLDADGADPSAGLSMALNAMADRHDACVSGWPDGPDKSEALRRSQRMRALLEAVQPDPEPDPLPSK